MINPTSGESVEGTDATSSSKPGDAEGSSPPTLEVEVLGMEKAVFEVQADMLQVFPGDGDNLGTLRLAVDVGIVSFVLFFSKVLEL